MVLVYGVISSHIADHNFVMNLLFYTLLVFHTPLCLPNSSTNLIICFILEYFLALLSKLNLQCVLIMARGGTFDPSHQSAINWWAGWQWVLLGSAILMQVDSAYHGANQLYIAAALTTFLFDWGLTDWMSPHQWIESPLHPPCCLHPRYCTRHRIIICLFFFWHRYSWRLLSRYYSQYLVHPCHHFSYLKMHHTADWSCIKLSLQQGIKLVSSD